MFKDIFIDFIPDPEIDTKGKGFTDPSPSPETDTESI